MLEPESLIAKGQYSKLENDREPYLKRARRAAKLTCPFLVPEEGDNGSTDYATPYQSIGARGVNNLASKLLVGLFPPNSPFTRHVIDEYEYRKSAPTDETGERDDEFKAEIEKGLASVDRAIATEIESSASRPTFFETLKHLLVAGNGLLYLPQEGGLKLYHLDQYVVKRDPMGHVLDIIVKEAVSPTTLPESVQEKIPETQGSGEERKTVDLYTRIVRPDRDSDWESWQEVKDIMLPDTKGNYPKDKNPWIPLRFSKIDGENYGRGYVEEYEGDLQTLEGLMSAIYDGSAASAKVVFMVNPNGSTRKSDLERAENGAIIDGVAEEVSTLQAEKQADMQVAWAVVQDLQNRLSRAFLLTEGVQRDAERVTAEEIRTLIQELESSIGGIHALLAQEFQLPVAVLFMDRMEKEQRLPKLPKGIIKTQIVTGIEAIGRGNDFQKLMVAMRGLSETLGPEMASRIINPITVATKIFVAAGVDDEGLIQSQEEFDAMNQQNQMQALIEKLGPNVVNQVGGMAQQQAGAES